MHKVVICSAVGALTFAFINSYLGIVQIPDVEARVLTADDLNDQNALHQTASTASATGPATLSPSGITTTPLYYLPSGGGSGQMGQAIPSDTILPIAQIRGGGTQIVQPDGTVIYGM
jgi:hypothetical protein